jgi:hypothetical protein
MLLLSFLHVLYTGTPTRRPPDAGVQCVVADSVVDRHWDQARELAQPDSRQAFRFAAFDSQQVALVRDPEVCRRAARGYQQPRRKAGQAVPRLTRIMVLRLGRAGYLIHAPEDWFMAGEFACDVALLDARFRYRAHLCG